jgi:hypothetical protein
MHQRCAPTQQPTGKQHNTINTVNDPRSSRQHNQCMPMDLVVTTWESHQALPAVLCKPLAPLACYHSRFHRPRFCSHLTWCSALRTQDPHKANS